jgi:hypothetical protein
MARTDLAEFAVANDVDTDLGLAAHIRDGGRNGRITGIAVCSVPRSPNTTSTTAWFVAGCRMRGQDPSLLACIA